MEAFGAGLLIFMMVVFGISALAQAYETSQRHKQDEEE
jgi:Flp pilus assembly protein TadG